MDKTLKDFRHFALDKCGVHATVLDDQIKNTVVPSVIEERPSAQRIMEINVFSRLIQDRILFLNDTVDSDSCNTLVAQMLYLSSVDNRDISMYISTPGGSVVDGLSVIDTMNFITPDIATTCIGMAASMGAVIFSNGAKGKRFVLPHSRIMIHQVSTGMNGKLSDLEIEMNETILCKKEIYQILADNCGKSYEEIEKDCNANFWLHGQEAIDYGIACKLITKEDKIKE